MRASYFLAIDHLSEPPYEFIELCTEQGKHQDKIAHLALNFEQGQIES